MPRAGVPRRCPSRPGFPGSLPGGAHARCRPAVIHMTCHAPDTVTAAPHAHAPARMRPYPDSPAPGYGGTTARGGACIRAAAAGSRRPEGTVMANDWRELLLSAMLAPVNTLTVDALQWWADSEGMPAWENNWLATTIDGYGGRVVNSAGVKAYPTVLDGVNATWATLSYPVYRPVVTAFRAGSGLENIWSAVNASPWCNGCQGGKYPVVLYNHLSQKIPPPNVGVITGGGSGGGNPDHARAHDEWAGIGDAFFKDGKQRLAAMSAVIDGVRRLRR